MSVTVLPLRDPGLPDYRPRTTTVQSSPGPRGDYQGMHTASVEILRSPAKRPAHGMQAAAAAGPQPAPEPAPAAPEAKAAQAAEIELPNGRIVRVPPGFSSDDLERVLAIASSDSSDDPPRSPP